MTIQSPPTESGITIAQNLALVAAAAIAALFILPRLVPVRTTSSKNSCVNILRQIDGAKEQWALETKRTAGEPSVDTEINLYLKGNARPACPFGGTYTYGRVGKPPRCSLAAQGHSL